MLLKKLGKDLNASHILVQYIQEPLLTEETQAKQCQGYMLFVSTLFQIPIAKGSKTSGRSDEARTIRY